jgi:lipoprotein-anchoring transpeptidase ErfK/SrfK
MLISPSFRAALIVAMALGLSACGAPQVTKAPQVSDPHYAQLIDGEEIIPAVPQGYLTGQNARTEVAYSGGDAPGSIIVDPHARVLYLVEEGGTAIRYGIAVGREGRGFRGNANIRRKEAWPRWQPTANMIRTDPEVYGQYRAGLPGGLENPLGARALYLFRGGRDTHFRIHGTNNSSTIGRATSAGCIRLFNQDAIDLFNRVELGTHVRVRSLEESIANEGELVENERGLMVPMASLPEDVQAQIRAGITPWPKFEPIVGVNATAPVVPDPITGELPAS